LLDFSFGCVEIEEEVKMKNKVLTKEEIIRAGDITEAIHKLEDELKEIYGPVQVELVDDI